jgi:hypothetical protein
MLSCVSRMRLASRVVVTPATEITFPVLEEIKLILVRTRF